MLSAIKDIGELVNQKTSTVDEKINGQVLFINLDTATSKYAGINVRAHLFDAPVAHQIILADTPEADALADVYLSH